MREIKFRAWDKEYKKMHYADCMGNETYFLFDDAGWAFKGKHENVITNYALGELMQFTGLEDKNGKEIYEGDILFTDYEEYREVKYSQRKYKTAYMFSDGHDDFYGGILNGSSEIIGNIYENPELLNEKEEH